MTLTGVVVVQSDHVGEGVVVVVVVVVVVQSDQVEGEGFVVVVVVVVVVQSLQVVVGDGDGFVVVVVVVVELVQSLHVVSALATPAIAKRVTAFMLGSRCFGVSFTVSVDSRKANV